MQRSPRLVLNCCLWIDTDYRRPHAHDVCNCSRLNLVAVSLCLEATLDLERVISTENSKKTH